MTYGYDDIYDPIRDLGPFGQDDILPEAQTITDDVTKDSDIGPLSYGSYLLLDIVNGMAQGLATAEHLYSTRGIHRGYYELMVNPCGTHGPNPANFDTVDWRNSEFTVAGFGRRWILEDSRLTDNRYDPTKANDGFFRRYFYTLSDTYTNVLPELDLEPTKHKQSMDDDHWLQALAEDALRHDEIKASLDESQREAYMLDTIQEEAKLMFENDQLETLLHKHDYLNAEHVPDETPYALQTEFNRQLELMTLHRHQLETPVASWLPKK